MNKLNDWILDCASGPFGSNLKVECFVESGFPIIDGANMTGVALTDNVTKFVTEEKARSLQRSIAKRHDVVVTISGTLGQVVYVPLDSEYEEYLCSQRQFRVTFDESKVDVEYLVYYLHTTEGQKKILSFANYVGVPALSQPLPNFKNIEVDFPDVEEQHRIVARIKVIDDKIANNNAICSNLEAMAKLLYDYWFVQFDFPDENGKPYKSSGGKMVWNDELKREIPAGWEAGVLGDVIEKYTDGISSSNIGDLPYTPMDILPMRQMSFSETGSQEDANSSLIRYKKYSLLFGAMRPYFHRVCIAPFDGITRTTVFTLKERGNGELGYAFETLDQDYTVNYANAHHVGTQQPYAEWDGNMEKCTIPLPPAELRRKYSQMISDYIDVVIERNLENKQLASLRDFLLPMLMNGQVKVGKESA